MKSRHTKVSVIICTFGQHPYLDDVIRALNSQTCHFSELIIVDNNFKASHFSSLVKETHNLKIVHLPQPNLARARNVGIRESKGDVFLFLDDDAIPSRDWIKNIVSGFRKYESDMIGGRVILSFLDESPRWFAKTCRLYLSELTYYNEDIENIIPPRYLVGANMSLTKDAVKKYGFFMEDCGRMGKKLISLEDVEMVRRIHKFGGKVTYINSADVCHIIPTHRASFFYLFRRSFWQGISDSMLEKIHPLGYKKNKKIPLDITILLELTRFLGKSFYNYLKNFE